MKQAKRHGEMHQHPVCGNCSRVVRIRDEKDKVACTSNLMIMPADYVADCGDFRPIEADAAVPATDAGASGDDVAK